MHPVSKSHQMSKSRWGEFWTSAPFGRVSPKLAQQNVPRRITPHPGGFLSPPRGETHAVSPHCHVLSANLQTTCAGALGRNSPSFAPREKRKKFRWGKTLSRNHASAASAVGRITRRCSKPHGGVLSILANSRGIRLSPAIRWRMTASTQFMPPNRLQHARGAAPAKPKT